MNGSFDRCTCGDLRSAHIGGTGRCLFDDCDCLGFTLSTEILTHGVRGGQLVFCSVWRPDESATINWDDVTCPACLRIRAKLETVPPEILAALADGWDAGVRYAFGTIAPQRALVVVLRENPYAPERKEASDG